MRSAIYHLMTRTDFELFKRSARYAPASLEKEGFIHFSYQAQVSGVANRFYAQHEELVLLEVEAKCLGEALVVEAALVHERFAGREAELFPHLYGELHYSQLKAFHRYVKNDQGEFEEL